jgi:AraC family transcriptional regulator
VDVDQPHRERQVGELLFLELRPRDGEGLVALGRVPLAEIAVACCFSSQSKFARAFRRATGTSPKDYRRRAV